VTLRVLSTVRAYLELCRVTNLPSVWSNVLAAFVLSKGAFDVRGYLLPALALSCLYLAGMSLNDLCDLADDREKRPSRPLPSGRASAQGAAWVTLSLFVGGIALLFFAPFLRGAVAALALIVAIVWYDLDHKRHSYSVVVMAACRFLVFPVTALAVVGTVPNATLLTGALQFALVLAISAVARYENSRPASFTRPVVPLMLAAIPVLDALVLAACVHPAWLLAGLGGAALMQTCQRYLRGD